MHLLLALAIAFKAQTSPQDSSEKSTKFGEFSLVVWAGPGAFCRPDLCACSYRWLQSPKLVQESTKLVEFFVVVWWVQEFWTGFVHLILPFAGFQAANSVPKTRPNSTKR